jgi:hypothetical protein
VITSVILGSLLQAVQAQIMPGDSLVVDFSAGTNNQGALFRVDPGSGACILLSGFGNAAQGPTGLALMT